MNVAAPARSGAQRHRGSIFVEDAAVLAVQAWPAQQYVVRIAAPRCAATALPGSFIHIRCDEHIPMRRPLSILRADATEGWIEVLFKTVGEGLEALAQRRIGDTVSVIGPIGRPFSPPADRPRALLVGGGVGIPPMVFLAERLHRLGQRESTLVLMGSEIPFPFETMASGIAAQWAPDGTTHTISSLESMQIPARLASLQAYPGTFDGYVTELGRRYLECLGPGELAETAIYGCGPTPMLAALAELAASFSVPAQVSLEEYMACAVGGCAGCAVRVETPDGPAMQRVCVDGPVFDAAAVFGKQSGPAGRG